jgi:hypothetical protein
MRSRRLSAISWGDDLLLPFTATFFATLSWVTTKTLQL